MKRCALSLCILLLAIPASAAGPGNTDLLWTNADPVALGVVVERHEGLCGGSTTFTDLPGSKTTGNMKATKDLTTAVGHEYSYRIRFWNTTVIGGSVMQYGPWSPEVGITYPLALPTAAPAGLSVN
jgi:hypothetical protein